MTERAGNDLFCFVLFLLIFNLAWLAILSKLKPLLDPPLLVNAISLVSDSQ